MSSGAVVGSAAAGSPGFRALFDAHFDGLAGLARLLGSDDPEDIAAEAFVRLHEKWATLRDQQAALGYARTTVVRLCSNRRRHLAVADKDTRGQQSGVHPSAEAVALDRLDDGVLRALPQLTIARRTAIVLRYYADLPYEQIGQALRCTASTARAHVRRGLTDLRRAGSQEGEGP